MEAGRELDLLIADKVLGIIRYRENDPTRALIERDGGGSGYAMGTFSTMQERFTKTDRCPECGAEHSPGWEKGDGNRWFTPNLPHYSTNLNDAFVVAEHLRKMADIEICLPAPHHELISVHVNNFTGHYKKYAPKGEAKTLPHAICLAALDAYELT